jgi:FkbM family methyltransferase
MDSIAPDLPDAWRAGRALVLYGAGGAGRSVARHLKLHGIAVAAFLDAGARLDEIRDDVPVFTLAQWTGSGRVHDCDVIVSIHNPFTDVAPIFGMLRAAGFARILSMVDYLALCPDDPQARDWLVPAAFYRDKRDRLDATRALLADDLSRSWFDATLHMRLEGRYDSQPVPRLEEQYIPADLPRWREPMRLIDCGAYDGDTIAAMLAAGYRLDAVAAFEPDPANYARLVSRCADLDAVLLPCGVAATAGRVHFHAGQGTSSRIDETGQTTIQCVGIDEALPSFAPTLIKMDIEAAEPAALCGAARTLRRHRPGLAIALYHRPGHLWEIPLWLAELDLGYRMYLRGHLYNGYELILYCRAD